MKQTLCRILFLLALLAPAVPVLAQSAEAHTRIADRFYQRMAYAQAKEEYKLAADLGAVNEHVTRRLADCYMRLGRSEEAELWHAHAVKYLNREPRDLYGYAEALKSNGRYQEAEEWMDRYLQMVQTD